jgi:menaquinone-dependent protoporphyrinogen IX oxidase
MSALTVAYGSRFGRTAKLAEEIAVGLRTVGAMPQLIDVAKATPIEPQPLVILSAIIWDRPVPVMREWITANIEHGRPAKYHNSGRSCDGQCQDLPARITFE